MNIAHCLSNPFQTVACAYCLWNPFRQSGSARKRLLDKVGKCFLRQSFSQRIDRDKRLISTLRINGRRAHLTAQKRSLHPPIKQIWLIYF